jgi:uncharacterized protein YydD (DUF2326 family)
MLTESGLYKNEKGAEDMTALRQQAYDMIQEFPENKIGYVIDFLKKLESKDETINNTADSKADDETEHLEALAAWGNFQKFKGIVKNDIDEKAELAKAREEKYAGVI